MDLKRRYRNSLNQSRNECIDKFTFTTLSQVLPISSVHGTYGGPAVAGPTRVLPPPSDSSGFQVLILNLNFICLMPGSIKLRLIDIVFLASAHEEASWPLVFVVVFLGYTRPPNNSKCYVRRNLTGNSFA